MFFLRHLKRSDVTKYNQEKSKLNALEKVDYEQVLALKLAYIQKIFDKQKRKFTKDKDYQQFFRKNAFWLIPYAVFCYLRDKYKTPDFRQWRIHAIYQEKKIKELANTKSTQYNKIAIHYFLQYHLYKQLKEAVEYVHRQGISVKGDIPIGINMMSVEAWQYPYLFNMDMHIGAPPDSFTETGQNWYMPSYNWEGMEKDRYTWWKKRFENMAEYFDAYRIDHILGFFRMWKIHNNHQWGLLGHFSSSIPYSLEELQENGLAFDYDRLCRPYIKEHVLDDIFGEYVTEIKEKFLKNTGNGIFELKEIFNTQSKIKKFFEFKASINKIEHKKDEVIEKGLMKLCAEVLFITLRDGDERKYHPRILMHDTYSYRDLDPHSQKILHHIYSNFYYHRHNELWKTQAMLKLPTLVNATDMLACGEDLGMIPGCVAEVMDDLKILSLEIQRMPKEPKIQYSDLENIPYLSVCTTSTHDMSTMRMWWEENTENSRKFYSHVLGKNGVAPYTAEDWLCKEIIDRHFHSPAMWVIIPLQDLLAMGNKIRWEKTNEERINIPAVSHHYWRYRMHLSVEELLDANDFNTMLREMVNDSNRCM